MASDPFPSGRKFQRAAVFGRVLAATALLIPTAHQAFAECTDTALDDMADICGEKRFGHDGTGGAGTSGGGAGTQDATANDDECKRRAGSLGKACTDAYNREMAELKKARSPQEVAAIRGRLEKIVNVIESFQDDVADGEFKAKQDPAVQTLLALKTANTDEAVEAALERVKNPAGPGETPGDTPGGKPTSGRDAPGPGGQTTASAENRVEDLLKNGDYAGALALLDGLGSQGVQSPRLEAMRAMALLNAGDKDGALKAAERALQLDPDNSDARQVKLYLEAGGQVKDTKLQVKRPDFGAQRLGSDLGGGSGESLAMGRGPGRVVGDSGDGPGAPGAVPGSPGGWAAWDPGSRRDGGALGGRPGAPTGTSSGQPLTPSQTLVSISLKKARLGDMSGALLDATRAIQADKANARAWTVRAGISNRLKNHDAAISDATEALKIEPKSVPALLERGFAQYGLANYSSALSDIGEALKLEPLNALAYLYRGMVFEKMARYTEALSDYEKAAGLDPSLRPFWEEAKARLLGKKGASGTGGGAGKAVPYRALLAGLAVALVLAGLWKRSSGKGAEPLEPGGSDSVLATGVQTAPLGLPPQAAAPTMLQDASALAVGSLLAGTYRIDRELARGGMGVVYAAQDVKLQRRVALKRLKRESYDEPGMRERFLKEARLAARLRHPNLAEIFAVVGEEDLYLVFELVEGETLESVIAKSGRLGLEETKKTVGEVCGALGYAHDEGVIHRDLKPSNVMLDKDGRAKVMDFGIAHDVRGSSRLTQTAAWGTPPYMAPEQEMGRVGKESDLYALAVMTYEMLTGARPFAGPYFLEKKLKKEFPPATTLNGKLPRSVDAFFAKALDPEPGRRFETAGAFDQAFHALA